MAQLLKKPSFRALHDEFRPARLLPSLTAGTVAGIIDTTLALAYASLIFSGELSPYVPQAIGMMLLAQMIINVTFALFTSVPGLIAGLQDIPAAVLAVTAAAIATQMAADSAPQAMFWTVMAVLCIAAFTTGTVLWLLGHFKLGYLVRLIPYPVMGGFLGGTGLLLARGGISVLTNTALDTSDLTALWEVDVLVRWLPGLALAVLLLVLLRRYSSPLIIPGIVGGTIAAFYIVLWLNGSSVSEASANGWMLITTNKKGAWEPWSLTGIEQIDWGMVIQHTGSLSVIAALSAVAALLNITGLELRFQQNINLNQELKMAGAANMLVGFVGGGVGYHVLSTSLLSDRLGARGNRMPGVLVGVVSGLTLLLGGGLLAYTPNLLLGGLILFLGLDLLVEWVYHAWFKFSRIEYAMVIGILLTMNSIGFMEGIAMGIALSVILFAITYGKTPVVKQVLTGATYTSHVVRSRLSQSFIRSRGDWITIFKLQGYLFFGTAHTLLDLFRTRLADTDRPALHYMIFDFRRVTGMDSSAALSFTRIMQIAQAHEIEVVFTALSPGVQRQLVREVLYEAGCHVFPDLDRGMEWCENQLLNIFTDVGLAGRPITLVQQLKQALGTPDAYDRLMLYFDREEVTAGHILIRQGESAKRLYFIEQGQVTIQLEPEDGKIIRLRRLEAGTIVGEIGLYLNRSATASVIADQPCTVYRLTAAALQRMETESPDVAATFHRFMVALMAERLVHITGVLETLND